MHENFSLEENIQYDSLAMLLCIDSKLKRLIDNGKMEDGASLAKDTPFGKSVFYACRLAAYFEMVEESERNTDDIRRIVFSGIDEISDEDIERYTHHARRVLKSFGLKSESSSHTP